MLRLFLCTFIIKSRFVILNIVKVHVYRLHVQDVKCNRNMPTHKNIQPERLAMPFKRNLLDRLKDGVVVGDGSFGMTLEKRGYLSIGSWTPEATILYPDAVRSLHRDYLRAGSDVMQTFTFYASDDTLGNKRSTLPDQDKNLKLTGTAINSAACDLAREIADEGDALVAGGLSPVAGYRKGKGKVYVQEEFRKQCRLFAQKNVDFVIGEFFNTVEEAVWAIEVMQETNKPVACTLRICTVGDVNGVSPQECAVRMAKAGADVIGINCMYDPDICLETLALMKSGLQSAGLDPYLIAQPFGFHTKDIATNPLGHYDLPEFPFALETRLLNRMDVRLFARKAYDLGVRYIGGCCGFEPYHIRAIAEELAEERGKRPPGADMSPGVEGLKMSLSDSQRKRATHEYWNTLMPGTGRNVDKKATDA